MTIHAMSPVDAAWYHMDGPANPAVITGILLTKRPLDFEKVRAVYQERIVQFDRFHQRVVERGFPWLRHWEDMPHSTLTSTCITLRCPPAIRPPGHPDH